MNPYENPLLRDVCGDVFRPGGLTVTREAVDLCAWPAGARLWDLGCGAGATLKLLRERGFEATGLDASPALAAEARAHGPVVEGDFHDLPLEDEFLDGIVCECVLSLARDPARVLAECARVLKAGGRLAVSDLVRAGDVPAPLGGTGCLAGAVSPSIWARRLETAGFAVTHQRDHRRALTELAARLVWRHGSAAMLANWWGGMGCSGGLGGKQYGYTLFVAVKR